MPALSGQIKPKKNAWGKTSFDKIQPITPQENLAQVKGWMQDWGTKKLEQMGKTPAATATNVPAAGTASDPVADPVNVETIKKESTGPGLDPAKTNIQTAADPAQPVTPPAAPATPSTPATPPPGILPGTPAYAAWEASQKKAAEEAAKAAPASGVTPDGGPAKPPGGGLVIKGKSGKTNQFGGKTFSTPDITVPEELLSKLTPEMRADVEKAVNSGQDIGVAMMKYWSDPNMQELATFMRETRMKNRSLNKKPSNVGFEKGNTGIKWMDQKYADNMWAKDPENPANKPKEPTPASGNGTWVQGPNGPIWKEGGQQEHTDFVGRPGYGGEYGGINPGGGNPYQQWMQQQFMQQYGMR